MKIFSQSLLIVIGALAVALAWLSPFQTTKAQELQVSATPSTWLVLRYGVGGDGALEKILMADMAQCEMQAAVYESSKTLSEKGYGGHVCLEGK